MFLRIMCEPSNRLGISITIAALLIFYILLLKVNEMGLELNIDFPNQDLIPVEVKSETTESEFWPSLDDGLPLRLMEYIKEHGEKVRKPDMHTEYIVYTCTEQNERCGGIGDRLRGIVSLFMLSISTNRVLVIDWSYPFALEETLIPGMVDWLAPLRTVQLYETANPHKTVSLLSMGEANYTEWTRVSQSDAKIVRITTNNIRRGLSALSAAKNMISQMDLYRPGQRIPQLLCSWILRSLFVPNPDTIRVANEQLALIGIDPDRPFVAIHARFGHTNNDKGASQFKTDPARLGLEDIPKIARCASKINSQMRFKGIAVQNATFLAADSNEGKYIFREQLQDVKYFSAHAFHIDKVRKDRGEYDAAEADMLNQLTWAEFLILSKSECVVSTRSGFSEWAIAFSKNPQTGKRCAQAGTECENINWNKIIG
ncbi:hypothetical protein SARC_12962 [Sphaeroforma arctica JP610]|uniref:GT23 domain-containing protein n=1 Tax=Sphaeroforma arctica JP610 TaxID=667725 RepID=A0A0L0FCL9_9EUKA|nr:hypothetical protein SARC_12962 [Sphaeroforma arctica JP610]KNC74494.1 hypothetical protein SARC_12962 [Sphaeroforma arctica JP610]|eukprot:XP_014148396.1 hypothetical protein SARC_12962 [Sphaeroforma arctica JP610]